MNKQPFNKHQIIKSLYEMMSAFKVSINEHPYCAFEIMENDEFETYDMLSNAVDLVLNNPNIEDKDIHDYWNNWAIIHKPKHLSLIPFEELSDTEKMKDAFIIALIRSMAKYCKI